MISFSHTSIPKMKLLTLFAVLCCVNAAMSSAIGTKSNLVFVIVLNKYVDSKITANTIENNKPKRRRWFVTTEAGPFTDGALANLMWKISILIYVPTSSSDLLASILPPIPSES